MSLTGSRSRVLTGITIGIVVLVLDQIAKWQILRLFDGTSGSGLAVTPFFNLVLTFNHGVTFGMFNGAGARSMNTIIFSLVASAIVVGLLFWLRQARSIFIIGAIGLIIGGAIGNMTDRIRLGGVVDFLDFHWRDHHYWAFNVADSAICIGVALLLIDSFRKQT